MRLTDFKALTFDCYGTLIDWESGIMEGLKPLLEKVAHPLTRDQVLQAHARHESTQQRHTPTKVYRDLLPIVYKRLAEEWGVVVSHEECVAYGLSVRNWPAFPDSQEALRYLKKHYKLVILSNVDNETFSHSNKRLGVDFDAIITAEDVGAYKPSPLNFECLTEVMAGIGIQKTEILHTAESLFHDHKPANAHGLHSCWIHRRHEKEGFGATMHPGDLPKYDFYFTSMGAMAAAHMEQSKS